MRQSPHSKRPRGGRPLGRRGSSHGGNRTFESSGPHVKIRGNASQLFEKYQALARDATTSGDRVAAENYLQHAEHYFRVLSIANDGQQRGYGAGNGQARPSGAVASAPSNPDGSPGVEAEVKAPKPDGGGDDGAPT